MPGPRQARPDVLLRIASKEQREAAISSIWNNLPAWRGSLSCAETIDIFRLRLDSVESLFCWVLVPKDDPDTLDFLASCETWRSPALYVAPGSRTPVIRPALTLGSVYVPDQHRGCQLSYELLTRLKAVFTESQTMKQIQPVLNDIFVCGTNSAMDGFYRAFSNKMPSDGTEWSADNLLPDEGTYTVRDIVEADFERLAERDVARIKRELPLSGSIRNHRFAFVPDLKNYRFRARVTEYMALGAGHCKPDVFGAEIVDKTEFAFVIWSRCWEEDTLVIQRLRAATRSQLVALIRAAQLYARQFNLKRVYGWSIPNELLGPLEKSTRRHDYLWDIQFFEDETAPVDRLTWHLPEAFGALSCIELYG